MRAADGILEFFVYYILCLMELGRLVLRRIMYRSIDRN